MNDRAVHHPDYGRLADVEGGWIDRRVYQDESIYARELEQIFARCWLLIGHECQVPNAHDFITAYMGEDPVVLTRDEHGELHCFLNMCRHRGNRVARADSGNTRSFLCSFHGWSYAIDGRLEAVPGERNIYMGRLDTAALGLVKVAQLATYKGLVFATFDPQAPSLLAYLGDMAWYLDIMLDRREGGAEFIHGTHKWMIPSNWKFPADNFVGDTYHGLTTHIAAMKSGFMGMPQRKVAYGYEGYQVNPGGGHGLGGRWAAEAQHYLEFALPEFVDYERERLPEAERRLGAARAWKFAPIHGTVFPNMSLLFQSGMIRVWHPRGPRQSEIWSWCVVDKAAPESIRREMRRHEVQRHGPSGTWDTDDVDNWVQCTTSCTGAVSRRYANNLQMGLGHAEENRELRGSLGRFNSEANQRGFYRQWARLMEGGTWTDVPIAEPR